MKRLLFTILLTAGSLLAAVAQPVQGARPDKERFAHPTNADRIYMLQHSTRGNLEALIDNLSAAGFGGIVTNADCELFQWTIPA